jgi:hypothetical protein
MKYSFYHLINSQVKDDNWAGPGSLSRASLLLGGLVRAKFRESAGGTKPVY